MLVPMHSGKMKLKGKCERKSTKCCVKVESHCFGGIRALKSIGEGNSKNLGTKLTSLWIWRAQLPPNTWLEVQNLVASTRHFKCSHSPFPQLQKPPTHQVLPKNKVGWDGEAKDKQRCCHHIEAIFHFENRGDQWLGSIWECQKSCMDQWCSTREEGSANQDKSPGQSSGMLGNIWCFAGWTQQGWERL